MPGAYYSDDWDQYRMNYARPHLELEAPEQEMAEVDGALSVLVEAGILPGKVYDGARFLAHRQAVADLFEIPWTAITPRMQRLLYAVNAVAQPGTMVAAGVFCGNTFISNAGAAVGPGACYTANRLIGIEIRTEEAERAERNIRRIDPSGLARIIAGDAIDVVAAFGGPIDLLYLDADGTGGKGKGIYLDILESALKSMPDDALILAHNSVNSAEALAAYLAFVRDPANCRASVNIVFDGEGLEISRK